MRRTVKGSPLEALPGEEAVGAAAVAVQVPSGLMLGLHPELWYPGVTVNGALSLIDPDTGRGRKEDARAAARQLLDDIDAIARSCGLHKIEPIGDIADKDRWDQMGR